MCGTFYEPNKSKNLRHRLETQSVSQIKSNLENLPREHLLLLNSTDIQREDTG